MVGITLIIGSSATSRKRYLKQKRRHILKIAVDARTMGFQPSGIGIYLYDFLCELNKQADFEFVLLTDVIESAQIKRVINSGMQVRCFGKRIFRSIEVYRYFRFINKYLQAEQPDLFWEPNNLLPIRLKNYRGKIILTIHDLFPISKPEYFHWIYCQYFKRGIHQTVKDIDAVLFNSRETQEQALSCFPELKKKRLLVSYLIVKKPPSREIRDDGFFLYIGNLEKRKGTDLLLSAYIKYREKGGTLPLYLGGNIREKEIRKQMDVLQSEYNTIHYLGYLSEQKKYDYLASCTCFLFPSRAEGFGIPPLEAYAYKKKVITSNLEIFKETLDDSAKTFDFTDDLDTQIENLANVMLEEERENSPISSGCNILERYSEENLGKTLANFFRQLVENVNENSN